MKRLLLVLLIALLPSQAMAQAGRTKFVAASPVADTSIYASGDLIGGKLTFTNAVRTAAPTGYVVSITITDLAAQSADLDLVLFSSDPTATTFTDQSAFDVADADISKVLGVVSFASGSRYAWVDNGVKHTASLLIPVKGETSAGLPSSTIYGALVSRGTPTFASSSDVTVTLAISQD